MSNHRTTWYVTTHDKGWQVKRGDAAQAGAVLSTKKEAVARGKEIAEANTPSRLIIHTSAGKIDDDRLYGGDLVEVLTAQHRKVESLLDSALEKDNRQKGAMADLVGDAIEELSRHTVAEETVLYTTVRNELPSLDEDALEALEEHHVMKLVLEELQSMTPEDERFHAKVQVLTEQVKHHHREEEDDLFPALQKALTDQRLCELGDGIVAAYESGPTRPHPNAPDEGTPSVVAGVVTAITDRAMDAAGRVKDKVLSRAGR